MQKPDSIKSKQCLQEKHPLFKNVFGFLRAQINVLVAINGTHCRWQYFLMSEVCCTFKLRKAYWPFMQIPTVKLYTWFEIVFTASWMLLQKEWLMLGTIWILLKTPLDFQTCARNEEIKLKKHCFLFWPEQNVEILLQFEIFGKRLFVIKWSRWLPSRLCCAFPFVCNFIFGMF